MLQQNLPSNPSDAVQSVNDLKRDFIRLILTIAILLSGIGIADAIVNPDDSSTGLFVNVGATLFFLGLLVLLSVYPRFLNTGINLFTLVLLGILLLTVNEPFAFYPIILFLVTVTPFYTNRNLYLLTLAISLLVMLQYALGVFLQTGILDTVTTGLGLLWLFMTLIVSPFIWLFNQQLTQYAARAARTSNLLEASASVGQVMAQVLNQDELLKRSVELIRDRFAFYHVQIFLIDDRREEAKLVASTGKVGQELLERQHSLPLGSQSVIGRVIQIGEAVVARDTDTDGVHAFNELLPKTRSELALPILDGDQIIGALDVQSMRPDAFTNTDIQALQVMAAQLGNAIRNARLFEAQANSVRENKRLFLESETNLREIQRLNRQLTRQAWQDYLAQNRIISGVTLDGVNFRPGSVWTDPMQDAAQRRRPKITTDETGQSIMAVPIELRGEILGAIEIAVDDNSDADETLEMLQAITQRLALSLDNARLFEETQQATAQEQRIGEITSQYQAAATVDDLLKITLDGLTQTLGATRGAIRLTAPERDSQPETDGNAHKGHRDAQT